MEKFIRIGVDLAKNYFQVRLGERRLSCREAQVNALENAPVLK